MPVLVVGLSYRTSPVEVREQLAFAEAEIPAALARVSREGHVQEAVILSTCNRVEIYAATEATTPHQLETLRRFFLTYRTTTPPPQAETYALSEPESLQHLFRVAAGLDSMVLGETEILGQLKKAYDLALQHHSTGRRLNKAFQRAFNVAKHIRTETQIQRGSISVGSVAVDLAERIFSSLNERRVLVIGAGDTSEKTARALVSRGAQEVLVTNRSLERAAALAESLGGRAIPFEAWGQAAETIDIIISSTSAPHFILDRPRLDPLMHQRHGRPLLLIDIAVPRDIDPAVNEIESVYLYNIDDLQAIAADALRQRQEEIAHCEAIIRERVQGLLSPPPAARVIPSSPLAYGS